MRQDCVGASLGIGFDCVNPDFASRASRLRFDLYFEKFVPYRSLLFSKFKIGMPRLALARQKVRVAASNEMT